MYARVRKALPELYAFTVCMWLRSRSGGTGQGTPFSYSVPGQANEIVLLEAGHDPMELLINDKVSRPGSGGGGGTLPGAPALRQVPKRVGGSQCSCSAESAHMECRGCARLGSGNSETPLGTLLVEADLASERGCKWWCLIYREACEVRRDPETSPVTRL